MAESERNMATGAEWVVSAEQASEIQAVLAGAIQDLASWSLAEMDNMPEDTCDLWLNRLYKGLRRLDEHQRLIAISMLLCDEAYRTAMKIKFQPLDMDAL
jgi:hypothetical protein